jgi:hypothetical protein
METAETPVVVELPYYTTAMRTDGQVFTNYSNQVDKEVVEKLVDSPAAVCGTHGTKNPWWGYVWFEEGQFHEEIRLQNKTIALYHAATPDELMKMVNDVHGWD